MSDFVNDVRKEVKRVSDSIESKVALYARMELIQIPEIVIERAAEVGVLIKAFELEHLFHADDDLNGNIAVEMLNAAVLDNMFISEDLLLSREKIDPRKHEEIVHHPRKAFALVAEINLGIMVSTIIGAQHERIDRKGFPRGIVPLASAQVYNAFRDVSAMISERAYRDSKPLSVERACEEKCRDAGFVNQTIISRYIRRMPRLHKKYIN